MSMTVTATASGNTASGGLLTVKVLTGASGSVGAVANSSTALEKSVTPTASGSWVYFACGDSDLSQNLAASAASTFSKNALVTGESITEATGRSTSTTTSGTAVTVGATNTPGLGSFAAAEILAAAGHTLAEDASSPAAVQLSSTAGTTASFTPPSGAVLVVQVVMNNGKTGVTTVAVTDSAGSTYTLGELENASTHPAAGIWVVSLAEVVTSTGSSRLPKPGIAATAAEAIPGSGSARLPKPGPHAAAAEVFRSAGSARLPKPGPHVTAAEVYPLAGGVRLPKPGPHATATAFENAGFVALTKPGPHGAGAVSATGPAAVTVPKPGPHAALLERIPAAGSARLPKMGAAAQAFEGDNLTGGVRLPKPGPHAAGVNAEQARASVRIPKPGPHATALESFPLHGGLVLRKFTLSGTAGQQPAGLGGVRMPKMAAAGRSRLIIRFTWNAPDKLSRTGGVMQ